MKRRVVAHGVKQTYAVKMACLFPDKINRQKPEENGGVKVALYGI